MGTLYCVTKTWKDRKTEQENKSHANGTEKRDNTIEIYFYEASHIIDIHTHNTNRKNRLTASARRFPDLCKQTDEDAEQCYKAFEISKGRFSFRLTAPYSEERRRAASKAAKHNSLSRTICPFTKK